MSISDCLTMSRSEFVSLDVYICSGMLAMVCLVDYVAVRLLTIVIASTGYDITTILYAFA